MKVTKQFITAGDSIFTISCPDGTHHTYRVQHVEANDKFGESWFAKLLTGPDNTGGHDGKVSKPLCEMRSTEKQTGRLMPRVQVPSPNNVESLQCVQGTLAFDGVHDQSKGREAKVKLQEMRGCSSQSEAGSQPRAKEETSREGAGMARGTPRDARADKVPYSVSKEGYHEQGGDTDYIRQEESGTTTVRNLSCTVGDGQPSTRPQPHDEQVPGLPVQGVQQWDRVFPGESGRNEESRGVHRDSRGEGRDRPVLQGAVAGRWRYLGKLDDFAGQVRATAKSCRAQDSFELRLLNRVLARVWGDDHAAFESHGYKLVHEGRCGRCGRTLTVPESVTEGIGPECRKIMGMTPLSRRAKQDEARLDQMARDDAHMAGAY